MPLDPKPDPKEDIIPWAVGMLPDEPKSDGLLVAVALGAAPLVPGTVDGVVPVVAGPVPAGGAPEGGEDPSGGVMPEGGVPLAAGMLPAGTLPSGILPSGASGSSVEDGTTVLLLSPMAEASLDIFTAPISVTGEDMFADINVGSAIIIDGAFVSSPEVVDKIPWPKYTTSAINRIVKKIFRMAKTLMSSLIILPSSIHRNYSVD